MSIHCAGACWPSLLLTLATQRCRHDWPGALVVRGLVLRLFLATDAQRCPGNGHETFFVDMLVALDADSIITLFYPLERFPDRQELLKIALKESMESDFQKFLAIREALQRI